MSQKAIKKRTKDSLKAPVHIPVQSLEGRGKRQPGPLPQKSFPLNKFIALPDGLRPKSNQSGEEIKSPRRNIPIKAVVIPSGPSSIDSRANVYVTREPQAYANHVTSEAYITRNGLDQSLRHNKTTVPTHVISSKPVRSRSPDKPFATSTPRSGRRGYQSAQNSPRASTPQGSIKSTDSFDSSGSQPRRYKKRSQSAPAENRRKLQDTDYVIKKWSENDIIPGLVHGGGNKYPYDTGHNGLSITSENWTTARVGIYPNGVVRTIYRSNSVNSGRSVDSFNSTSIGSLTTSEVEFTDVCKPGSIYGDNSIVSNNNVSVQNLDFASDDTCNDFTGVTNTNVNHLKWETIPDVVCTKTVNRSLLVDGDNNFQRSQSDFYLDKINMEERSRRNSISSSVSGGVGRSYEVNGIPQTGIIIKKAGGHTIIVDDHKHNGINGTDFFTVGRKQGTLMQSKLKFSSMPTLVPESKGDKKLMKLLKKQEKEERKRKEKEEKKRAKEEKKRLKMEKKLKTKTLPRNFQYQNGHVMKPGLQQLFRRPMMSMSAVPINIEDDDHSSLSSQTPAPKMAPPPPPEPSQRTMSLYASAPDLLRLEQIYGATLRGVPKQYSKPIYLPSDYGARTVVLQRAKEGYGFVLRGAKSQLKPSGELDFRPTAEFPALQYLDSVDPGSVSDRAGLKGGDFILEINGENVVRASHDRVVHLIRSTGDTLAMKVVTVKSPNMSPDWFVSQDKSMTMPNRKKKAAPMPPQRDPRTSLSMSRSEGYAVSEEMAAMEKLDDAILGHQESEEKKTASIRNRTAAKRVSCVDMENIGVDGRLERSKSTPDLLDNKAKTTIYATPTVPDKKSNVYAVPGVNATSTGSPTGVQMRPKNAPPPPPPEGSPKKQKQAPRPPGSDSGESSSSEFVSIKMKKESPYASSKIYVAQPNKRDSQYESSFRPGDSAKLSEEPKETGNYKPGTPKQSPGGVTVRVGDNNSDKQNVSFAEDKVIDHAASFLKKHPNAKLLITADGQASMRKRTSKMIDPESFENEPAPDYDSDSGEDKPRSPVKMRDAFRQSVTVISVGDRKQASPATKRYTVHSSIPSEEKQASGFVIPPRPSGPAPAPPGNNQKKSAPMPPSQSPKLITVRAEVNNQPPQFDEVEAPPLPQTPPPDFEVNQSKTVPPAAPPLPPSTAPPPAPPPPPPPPPAPSVSDVIKTKSSAKADYIAPVPVPTDAIAAAVLKRQERMKTDGPLMSQQKTNQSPTTPPVDSNQAAILAAVARRRQQLEKQSDTDVIDSIESKLQKTKKLQAAKFQIAGSKSVKRDTDSKSNDQSKSASNNKPSITVQSSSVKPATSVAPAKTLAKPVKAENTTKATELSFKVKPVTVTKPQTDNKAKYAPYPLTSNTNSNKPSTVTSAKVNETRKFKPEPIVKSETNTLNSQSNNGVKTGESTKPENTNGQSDYLALAEKKRQEWLQRKQKSSESKSSSTSGTPEKTRPQVSPPVSAKPSKKVINGDVKNYTNVPPPPPGFRDGGSNETTVQLEIIPPPMNFTADNGTKQHSPAFSPDTASLVSSLSTLSSLSGDHNDGPGNGFDDIIAPPPPGFDDSESSVIPPPPEFGNDNNGNVQKITKSFNDKPINQWLCNDVLDWLDSLNLSQYKSSFQTNCIDGKKLVSLSRNNYIDLGVTTVGHRMNLERSIKKASAKTQTSKDIIASEHL